MLSSVISKALYLSSLKEEKNAYFAEAQLLNWSILHKIRKKVKNKPRL